MIMEPQGGLQHYIMTLKQKQRCEMAALGVRCNQMLGLKANVYQIILAIHLEAIGNVKQATYFSVSGPSLWFLA